MRRSLSLLFLLSSCASPAVVPDVEPVTYVETTPSPTFHPKGAKGFSVCLKQACFEHNVYKAGTEDVLKLDNGQLGYRIRLFDFDGDQSVDTMAEEFELGKRLSGERLERANEIYKRHFEELEVEKFFKLWEEEYRDPLNFY